MPLSHLKPFKVISFDLDDTLYDNKPVLARAQQRLLDHLGTLGNQPQLTDGQWWHQQKLALLAQQPQLEHDTTACRLITLQRGLQQLAITDADNLAEQAMNHFLRWRSDIQVSAEVIELLQQLAARYPLAVITNGNADVSQFLPQVPFQAVLAAGQDGLMKPDPDLFAQCCQRLNIAANELLHIGDHPLADVAGAIEFGAQALWLSPQYNGVYRQAGAIKPSAEISSLAQLRQLL
ncbi:HAD-IA family hydrolase [Ferrimonas senticii]|uniref:HAD-IA family hydrolase n=1 Tax=Ferrimonas senticii TaxID=394566 RepID=UPI0003FDD188|nr:HAD-IA family hydrolase [Ferrimonas senticii]